MGPRSIDRGIRIVQREGIFAGSASMGPRSIDRGIMVIVPADLPAIGFNGAAIN